MKSAWSVDVHPPTGNSYRDFTLMMQDEDEIIGNHLMPYTEAVQGVVGINYRSEPMALRLAAGESTSDVFNSSLHGDPATPLMESFAGDPVRIDVLVPYSEQSQVFSLEGHRWPQEPGLPGTDLLSAVQIGAAEAITLVPDQGAGGTGSLPGDYLYGDHREPFRQAGLWGIFRVHAANAQGTGIQALPGR